MIMRALTKNAWELVPLPCGKKVVGYKWVFSIKYVTDCIIERH